MEMHPCHYEPLTMDTLKLFSAGFPLSASGSNLELHEEAGEIVFGTFDVLLSDQLIRTAPRFITYVPNGRTLDVFSATRHHCIVVIARAPTKKVSFCKILTGSKFAKPLISLEQQSDSPLVGNGWNCLFLLKKEYPEQHISLAREVKGDQTLIGYTDSPVQKSLIEN